MIDKLKENAFLCFTLSLVASYFGAYGFYTYYNIDVSTYLDAKDLTMLFSKSVLLLTMVLWSLFNVLLELRRLSISWFDKKSEQKKLWIGRFILLTVIIVFALACIYFRALNAILAGLGTGIAILVCYVVIIMLNGFIKETKTLSEITLRAWFYLTGAFFLFVIVIPIAAGITVARYTTPDKVEICMDDGQTIDTSKSADLIYAGKLSGYFFIADTKSGYTTAYPMEKVRFIRVKTNTPLFITK